MRTKNYLASFGILICIISSAVFASDYYIDKNNPIANDSNPGTVAFPWRTITKANQTLVAGDTVYIKAGNYSASIDPNNSGTSTNPITYRNYEAEDVTIQNSSYGINLNGNDYIIVQGINFTGCTRNLYIQNSANYNVIAYCSFSLSSVNNWDSSVLNGNSQYNWIHHCQFSKGGECTSGGEDFGQVLDIGTDSSYTDLTRYNLIEDSVFFHGGHHLMGLYAGYNIVRNNYFHNEEWSRGRGNRTLYMVGREAVTGHNIIEGNRFGYAARPCDDYTVGCVSVSSHNNLFRHNKFYHNNAYSLGFYGYSGYSQGAYNKVYSNTIFNSGYNIYPTYEGGSEDTAVIFFLSTTTGNVLKNNLYFSNHQAHSGNTSGQTFVNNWNGDVQGNPLFIDASVTPPLDKTDPTLPNLDLQSTSPVIDSGGALTAVAQADSGSGITLQVTDASYFQDGTWARPGTVQADWIAIGTVWNVVQIASISGNTITLTNSIARNDFDPVWLYKKSDGVIVLYGLAPDIGAYEYTGSQPTPTVIVTSPNGGESWQAGSTHNITWTTTGTVGNLKLEYSSDNGAEYETLSESTPNDGNFSWRIPNDISSECLVKVSEIDGAPSDVSDGVFSITPSTQPNIALSRTQLNFGSRIQGVTTTGQAFLITNSGVGTLNWSITDNRVWLSCNPTSGNNSGVVKVNVNPSGLAAGTYTGTITVTDPQAGNSPQHLVVNLRIYASSGDSPPIGVFDTPADGLTVSGSVPVTGWALDDIEVSRIEIKRDPDPDDPPEAVGGDGLIYIGDAVFVKGARPDVEGLYPSYPLNDRAGWGYLMLTYGLPRHGNGTFRLYAFAEDGSGHRVQLGSSQITSDNANTVQPFGTIDTPNQGEVISDTYINFGWALTPPSKIIPTNGSTIWISIDGVFIGHPDYNHFRQDIYDSFPGYLNRGGAVGFYYLETTGYSNGVHNIGWYAVDDNGDSDGFGSRFFEIQNSEGATSLISGMDHLYYLVDKSGRLNIATEGPQHLEVEQMERIKIKLQGEGSNRFIGWGLDETKSLPVGSTLDSENGIFYWSIGPGFLGLHILHFAVSDGEYRSQPVKISIRIIPKKYDRGKGL